MGEFSSIHEINAEIRRLNLAAYAPLRYVLPHRREAYDAKYSTRLRGRSGIFRQLDREESLVQLLRVNVLKRMESSVASFALTVQRQLADVDALLARIDAQSGEVEELDIADIDIEDPAFESLLVGRKVKVLLQDVDPVRWGQDLIEDRRRLATLHAAASQVTADRDAKLTELRETIERKCRQPDQPSATARSSCSRPLPTPAHYLYDALGALGAGLPGRCKPHWSPGAGANRTTLPDLRRDPRPPS